MPTVTLTFDLATWFLYATHRLVLIIICAKWFLNPIMDNEVMGRTRIWNTQFVTHTHRLGKLTCPSAILWRGHKNWHAKFRILLLFQSHLHFPEWALKSLTLPWPGKNDFPAVFLLTVATKFMVPFISTRHLQSKGHLLFTIYNTQYNKSF